MTNQPTFEQAVANNIPLTIDQIEYRNLGNRISLRDLMQLCRESMKRLKQMDDWGLKGMPEYEEERIWCKKLSDEIIESDRRLHAPQPVLKGWAAFKAAYRAEPVMFTMVFLFILACVISMILEL